MAVRLSALRAGRILPGERSSGTRCCYRLIQPQGQIPTGGITNWKIKWPHRKPKRDFPACSIVPQPIKLPLFQIHYSLLFKAFGTTWTGILTSSLSCKQKSRTGLRIRGSSVGIAISYTRVRNPAEARDFTPKRPDRTWVPPNLLSKAYRGLFHWGWSRRGREAHHSSSCSSEVKNGEAFHSSQWRGA
jgi:hypothetical protein